MCAQGFLVLLVILGQEEKFQRLGPVESNDRTIQQERALQAYLLRQNKAGHITDEVYTRIRPVGATRPRMYGVPKVHKQGVPLRPILSMTNAPQHELAKWLGELLKPVLDKYSEHLVGDTFQFCENIESFHVEMILSRHIYARSTLLVYSAVFCGREPLRFV